MALTNLITFNQSSEAEMRRDIHFQLLVILKAFTAMLAGDESLQTVGELTSALLETPAYDLMAKQLNADPACKALIHDRYIPPAHNLDKLLGYPRDSLGYLYAFAMQEKGFDPNLHHGMTADSDASYVELRLSQTHDIWHLVTGFDTSLAGEIGLQAFHLPQFPYPLASMLIANSLVSVTLLEPETLPQLMQAIERGLQMGRQARSLFAQKWEDGWTKSLAQWRTELNVTPV